MADMPRDEQAVEEAAARSPCLDRRIAQLRMAPERALLHSSLAGPDTGSAMVVGSLVIFAGRLSRRGRSMAKARANVVEQEKARCNPAVEMAGGMRHIREWE